MTTPTPDSPRGRSAGTCLAAVSDVSRQISAGAWRSRSAGRVAPLTPAQWAALPFEDRIGLTVAQRLISEAVALLDPGDIPGFIRSLFALMRATPDSVLFHRPVGPGGTQRH